MALERGMTSRMLLPALAIAALAACSPPADEKSAETRVSGGPAGTPAPPTAPRETLLAEDVEGAGLGGELSCAFTQTGGQDPLLVAAADVDDTAIAQGVLKLGPSVLRVRAAEPGGFNAMVYGASFLSGDLAARVVVTSRQPLADGESPPLPARLVIGSEAGSQEVAGEWTCGP